MPADISSSEGDAGKRLITYKDYIRVLSTCHEYRLLYIAYCIDNMGNWLSFITCLAIIDRYGKASYTSLYFIFRLIPPVCLAGFTGPLADKLNKRDSMVICSLGSCLSVAVLALPWSEHLQLYVVLAAVFVQFSFDALYGPLRQSLIPYVVNEADLQVVTTLDSVAWSTVGAVGATLGGFICNTFGNRTGFVTDAISFVVVACITMMIPRDYEKLRYVSRKKDNAQKDVDSSALEGGGAGIVGGAPLALDAAAAAAPKPADGHLKMIYDTFSYLISDPKVLAVCCAKGCGAFLWSPADVLQVKFSNMQSMHGLGGQQLTLGFLYSMVGLGCYVGPVVWNSCTPQNGPLLFSRIVSTFANISVAFLLTVFAPNIFVLMFATVTRAFGAATLWTYSTLLLQLWAPADMMGRLFAFEKFVCTSVSIVSFFLCAALFDYWKLDERVISLMMSAAAFVVLCLWTILYFVLFKRGSYSGSAVVAGGGDSFLKTNNSKRL